MSTCIRWRAKRTTTQKTRFKRIYVEWSFCEDIWFQNRQYVAGEGAQCVPKRFLHWYWTVKSITYFKHGLRYAKIPYRQQWFCDLFAPQPCDLIVLRTRVLCCALMDQASEALSWLEKRKEEHRGWRRSCPSLSMLWHQRLGSLDKEGGDGESWRWAFEGQAGYGETLMRTGIQDTKRWVLVVTIWMIRYLG